MAPCALTASTVVEPALESSGRGSKSGLSTNIEEVRGEVLKDESDKHQNRWQTDVPPQTMV